MWPRKSLYAKLKPGPGRSSEEVVLNQRARLLGAMIELNSERGYDGVTVRSLARLAGVSTRTFYKHFSNTEECFAATYEWLAQYSTQRAYAAQAGEAGWEAALRASLRSLLEDIVRYPKASRLVLGEAQTVGLFMQPRIQAAVAGLARLLTDSFAASPEAAGTSPHLPRGIVAGAMRVARSRLLSGERVELEPLAGELGDWVLSLPGEHAAALPTLTSHPFRSVAPPNGSEWREGIAADILGSVGDEEGRILAAALKLTVTGGFEELTISKVRSQAGVSRRSFDARFNSVEECFLRALEAVATPAIARAEEAAGEASDWQGAIYTGIRALCTEIARNPQLARLAFVDILAAGGGGLAAREALISLGAEHLRQAGPSDQRPSALVAEATVAAAWEIVRAEVATGRATELPRLAPTLAYVVLAPVIGALSAAAISHDYPVLGV